MFIYLFRYCDIELALNLHVLSIFNLRKYKLKSFVITKHSLFLNFINYYLAIFIKRESPIDSNQFLTYS
jgi:hypothetical protein